MPMRYKLLGRSGLRVAELCLGTMTFGEDWGFGASKEESRRIFDTYLEAGGNFVDTANRYTGGTSERYLGEFIASERERIVLATKYTANVRPGDPNGGGNHRKSLVEALDGSLKRLGSDYIDVYWVHAWEYLTPVEEVMRALDDQVRAGKILYVGISDAPAWVVSRANMLAELRGWSPFIGLQIEYSLLERTVERELVPMAGALDLGVLAWGPLGGGALTGKYSANGAGPDEPRRLSEGDRRLTERSQAIAATVDEVAGEIGAPASQVAIAWLRARREAVVIPIVGARTASQLAETLGCLDLELSDDHLRRLDEASRVRLGFPHDFLAGLRKREVSSGGAMAAVDDHRSRRTRARTGR
jgi:aryl-alcohol dehydrogenase-like predicted oxidoreductase